MNISSLDVEGLATYLQTEGIGNNGVAAVRENGVSGEMFVAFCEEDIKDVFLVFKDRFLVRKVLRSTKSSASVSTSQETNHTVVRHVPSSSPSPKSLSPGVSPNHRSSPTQNRNSSPSVPRRQSLEDHSYPPVHHPIHSNGLSLTQSRRQSDNTSILSPKTLPYPTQLFSVYQHPTRFSSPGYTAISSPQRLSPGDVKPIDSQLFHLPQIRTSAVSNASPSPGPSFAENRNSTGGPKSILPCSNQICTISQTESLKPKPLRIKIETIDETEANSGSPLAVGSNISEDGGLIIDEPLKAPIIRNGLLEKSASLVGRRCSDSDVGNQQEETAATEDTSRFWMDVEESFHMNIVDAQMFGKSLSMYTPEELLTKKAVRGKPTDAQRMCQNLIRHAAQCANIWDHTPFVKDISAEQKELFFQKVISSAPSLANYREILWAKLRQCLQNRRKYMLDVQLGKRQLKCSSDPEEPSVKRLKGEGSSVDTSVDLTAD